MSGALLRQWVAVIIPTHYHIDIIDFKRWLIEENERMGLTPMSLREAFDCDILDCFFEILAALFNPAFPTLMNTDGELMQFCKSYFSLSLSLEDALHKLLPLALTKNPNEFLHDAKRNSDGAMTKIKMPWFKKGNKQHKDWNNTVMGHITIEKNRIVLETNSLKRTKKGKDLLNKYLGESVSFQQTLIESPEQKLRSKPKPETTNVIEPDILEIPEVREQIKQMAKAHWGSWFDTEIPALDNQTPREAAKTKNGREKLDALLLQYERHNSEDNLFNADMSYLKAKLSLE